MVFNVKNIAHLVSSTFCMIKKVVLILLSKHNETNSLTVVF